jgi:hypothetical protein
MAEDINIQPSNEAEDLKLKEAITAIDKGTLTAEQKNYLRDVWLGRSPEYQKMSPQEKADFLLKEWETSLISGMPSLETTKKEFYDKMHTIEIDESKSKLENTHVNIKAGKMRLVISSEGGKIITINNREALEDYRQALINGGKKKEGVEETSKTLHNSRKFS